MPRSPKLNRMASVHLHSSILPIDRPGLLPGPYRSMAQPVRNPSGSPCVATTTSALRASLVVCVHLSPCSALRAITWGWKQPRPSGPPLLPPCRYKSMPFISVKFLSLRRALARLAPRFRPQYRVEGVSPKVIASRSSESQEDSSVSELQLAVSIRMAAIYSGAESPL